jgi:transposase
MVRRYGWAPIGDRAYGFAPENADPNLTLVFGLRLSGIVAPVVIRGTMNGPTFLTYVQRELGPWLRPGDVVLADGLGAHRATGVREAIEATGANYLPLPPYSPDFAPIEQCGSKVKDAIRAVAPRTVKAVYEAVGDALGSVTRKDARGWFEHAGYVQPRPRRRRLRPGARYFPRRPPPLLLARGRTHGNRRRPERAPPELGPL